MRQILIALALISVSGCAALGPLSPLRPIERAIVYAPSKAIGEQADSDEAGNDVFFRASDGVRLHGRFFDHPMPRAVVLYCHGNAGSLANWSEVGRQLRERHQLAVLVFDYRGYGMSEGQPTEVGILEDARAARSWLAKRTNRNPSELVLMGRSLGGAVAVDLAANGEARGLILQSTFSSLPDVAAEHLPWLIPHWNMTQRLDSLAKIPRYAGPLLQSHGDADQLISIELARKLYAAAPGKKEFMVIPGAGHNDPHGAIFEGALDKFIDSLPTPESETTSR